MISQCSHYRKRNSMASSVRSARGSSAVELGIAVLVMIAVVAFGLNISMAMIGYTTNDRACRDAARSAAQGATVAEAIERAQRILSTYKNTGNPFFKNLAIDSLTYTDFSGAPPAGVSPFVKVVTSASSDIPCPVNIFGNNVFGNSLKFRKQYTFPIVKLTVKL